ncbi:unnamed protein product [Malus baccata var. baccata]
MIYATEGKMFNGVRVDFWAYVDFSLLDQSFNFRFCEDLVTLCTSKGVFGGRNTVAIRRRIPLVSDIPTIIFAADVTHPQLGKDSSLSIAAVVASMDWPQIIQDLYSVNQDPNNGLVGGGMIREHFRAFRQETGRKPERIIFYIDGVSEEQFCQVLLYEMDAIRKACQLMQEGYLPPLTFVVAQTGTVADTQFCHPRKFNFYLNSHASIQFELLSFVNMPTHYNVLNDENKFSPDCLQVGTDNICYNHRGVAHLDLGIYAIGTRQHFAIHQLTRSLSHDKDNIYYHNYLSMS